MVRKVVLVGLGLVGLVLLSPLILVVVAVLFGISVIALIARVARRRSAKRWVIVTVTSLVLLLISGGVSNAVYGTGLSGMTNSQVEVAPDVYTKIPEGWAVASESTLGKSSS